MWIFWRLKEYKTGQLSAKTPSSKLALTSTFRSARREELDLDTDDLFDPSLVYMDVEKLKAKASALYFKVVEAAAEKPTTKNQNMTTTS